MQLVADANVLLSAVIGGRAALVLSHEQVEQVFTPAAACDEVFEYLGPLAKKKHFSKRAPSTTRTSTGMCCVGVFDNI